MLEEEARKVRQGRAPLRMAPIPLYAGLPAANQLAAFEPPPRGYRKASSTSAPCMADILHISSCVQSQHWRCFRKSPWAWAASTYEGNLLQALQPARVASSSVAHKGSQSACFPYEHLEGCLTTVMTRKVQH
jgi:hypothetical protein